MSAQGDSSVPAHGRSAELEPVTAVDANHHAGRLGVASIVFMVLAGAAPLGAVAANYPVLVAVSQSVVTPLMFLIAGVVLVAFSVGFTRMARYVHDAGAFYSYVQAGLGRLVGVGAATLAVGAYFILFVAVAAYLGTATSALIVHFGGPETPWWIWSLAWVAVSGVLAYRNIDLSVKVLGFLLAVEVLIVIVLNVAIVSRGGEAGLSLAPLDFGKLGTGNAALGVMFAFFGFVGFEATAVFRNEARDPERTIPRATYAAVMLIAILYGVSAYSITVGAGVNNIVRLATEDPPALVLNLSTRYVAPIMVDVFQVFLLTSILACLVMFHNVLARYLQTLSSKGIGLDSLARIDPRYRAPSRASLAVTVPAMAFVALSVAVGLDPILQTYTWLSGAATLGILALMALTSLAVFVFFRRASVTGHNIWRTSVAPAVAFISLSMVVCLVVANFPLLTGGAIPAVVLLALVAATFVVGVVTALIMRSSRPDAYERLIGSTDYGA